MAPASSKEFLDIQANYWVCIHSETRPWHDNNIQSGFASYLDLVGHISNLWWFDDLTCATKVLPENTYQRLSYLTKTARMILQCKCSCFNKDQMFSSN